MKLTNTQKRILKLLATRGPMSQTEINASFENDNFVIDQTFDLRQNGLVRYRSFPSDWQELTEAGKRELADE